MTYKIQSTGCIVKLTYIRERESGPPGKQTGAKLAKPIYYFEYLNRNKEEIRCYKEDLEKNLYLETWVKISDK